MNFEEMKRRLDGLAVFRELLKDGAVAEQGSPAELLQSGGIFARMVKCQTESQNWTLEKA